MNFFKTFLASFLALVIFSVIGLVFCFLVVGVLTAEEQVVVKSNSVLHLNLNAEIREQQADNPFEGLPMFGNEIPRIGLLQLKEVIRYAKTDPAVSGIYLDVSYPMTGFATLKEIRSSLEDFRESGKWVVAYAEFMTEPAYYLASVADKVYLNPEGEVEFNGLTVEISFFKRLFDKLEIKPEIFRVGDYKSAVEPFMLEKMSTENREQLSDLVNNLYGHVLQDVAASRGLSVDQVKDVSDHMRVRNSRLAVDHGLVDSLVYYDQLLEKLKQRLQLKEKEKVSFIKYARYRRSMSASRSSQNEIAVVVADGAIMPGTSNEEGTIGSETFTSEMRRARENSRVKAIVVRVNSPGGSFQASDAMWREITLTAQKKPVIASMADYAASGGYYLAMGCDTIVAQPHTITGSIGVFSVLFDASGFLGNKLGITSDEVRTGEFGELVTISRPLSDAEKGVWQTRTNEIYETFTGKAAQGRDVSQEDIKKVASGRVWTGEQARDRSLIDVLGGFEDAVEIAASAAGISGDYRVRYYPVQKSFVEQLISSLEDNSKTQRLKEELGLHYPYYQQWKALKGYHGMQARMPFSMQIR
jgi:protease-4